MKRYCLALDLVDDNALIMAYEEHHRHNRQVITAHIRDAGITDMEIYRIRNRLFMIIETKDNFSFERKAEMDNLNPEVQAWEQLMWKYQQPLPGGKAGEKWQLMKKIYKLPESSKTLGLVLIISLFFLWALTSNLLPTLIPHLKKACRLTNVQSSFLDTAYWLAYSIMAIPAAIIMNRTSYKTGIIIGLLIAAAGALLFVPAAHIRAYWFFLIASFILASGMTFLETAANPYITVLGSPATAAQRLNFAQAFNGLGAFLSAMVLSKVILSGKEYTEAQLNSMPANELTQYLNSEADAVKLPYIGIALLLFLVALLFIFVRFPSPEEEKQESKTFSLNAGILNQPRLRWGVVAQFFYCGGQVCVSSFFIRYCQFQKVSETTATTYLGFLLLFFMVGRYVGAFLMKKNAAHKMLTLYGLSAVLLLFYAVVIGGKSSIYALYGVEFFMSIMFPTIFSLAIKGLGKDTKSASAFMVMSIIGGALLPLVMGVAIDFINPQTAYLVPMVCFLVVAYYGSAVTRLTPPHTDLQPA